MTYFKHLLGWTVVICFTAGLFTGAPAFAAEKVNMEKILEKEEWKNVYEAYNVDESMVETLAAKTGENLKIEVYLAFWCGDSKNNVPPFLKIIEQINALNGSQLPVSFYNCERKASKEVKYYHEALEVERVPTFIFYRDGKEIGRIIENPKQSLIEDFLEIIF